jgi:hypothetical protein
MTLLRPDSYVASLGATAMQQLNAVHLYMQQYWIDRVVPDTFSVFGCEERSNGKEDSYHKCWEMFVPIAHPNMWDFISK